MERRSKKSGPATIESDTTMRIGKYLNSGHERPFLQNQNHWLDWSALRDHAPEAGLRDLMAAALEGTPAAQAAFFTALPGLETWLARDAAQLARLFSAHGQSGLPQAIAPPCRPLNFICVGLNYRDHALASGAEPPAAPLLFAKTGNAIHAHGAPIRLPQTSQKVDYEAELAVVIGRRCHGVSAADALAHVAGYCCGNDISARDFQFADGQWYRGKSGDGFGPFGPVIVTPKEAGDPHQLRIQLRLNGQKMQDSNTSNLIFSIPELIAYISKTITLESGDVIFTGTPPGVGFARKPPVYLKNADLMEVEIENLGILANSIVAG